MGAIARQPGKPLLLRTGSRDETERAALAALLRLLLSLFGVLQKIFARNFLVRYLTVLCETSPRLAEKSDTWHSDVDNNGGTNNNKPTNFRR